MSLIKFAVNSEQKEEEIQVNTAQKKTKQRIQLNCI